LLSGLDTQLVVVLTWKQTTWQKYENTELKHRNLTIKTTVIISVKFSDIATATAALLKMTFALQLIRKAANIRQKRQDVVNGDEGTAYQLSHKYVNLLHSAATSQYIHPEYYPYN